MCLRIVEVFIRIEKLRVQQLFSAYLIKRTAIEYAVLQEKILIHGFFAKDTKYNLPSFLPYYSKSFNFGKFCCATIFIPYYNAIK